MSEQTAVPAEKKADPMPRSLPPLRFKQAEYERTIYRCVPEAGTSLGTLLEPPFWAHVAAKLKPYDRIEVIAEDNAYFAELLVLETGRMWAKVRMLTHVMLDAGHGEDDAMIAAAEGDPEYRIEFKGPHRKHVVVRNSDDAVVKEGISTKGEASQWLRDHIKSLAH